MLSFPEENSAFLSKSDLMLNAIATAQFQHIIDQNGARICNEALMTFLELTHSEYGFIGEVLENERGPYVKVQSFANMPWDEKIKNFFDKYVPEDLCFYNLNNVIGLPVLRREAVILNDPEVIQKKFYLPSDHPPLHRYCGIPLFSGHHLVGVIGLANKPSPYTLAEVDFLIPFLFTMGTLIRARLAEQESQKKFQMMLKRLKRSNEELSRFAHICSHDLKEPLRTISSFAQLLQEQNLDETGYQYLDLIINGTHRMRDLIHDLLNYAKMDATSSLPLQQIDLNKVMEEIQIDLSILLKETGGILNFHFFQPIVGDRTQIKQLFQNLISNGLKFNDKKKSCITIAMKDIGRWFQFSIQDNGIGIPKMYQDKIFMMFERLHTTQTYRGTGIGLSLCRKIVETNGGKIWFESEEGKGSTFFFTWPKTSNYQSL